MTAVREARATGEHAFLMQRANYYRYLARLFYEELDDALIEQIATTQEVVALDDEMSEDERALALGTNKMVKYLQRRNPDTMTRTKVDYAALFLGCGAPQETPVSPFESVYTSEERLLMQGARDDVYRCLRADGLVIDDHYNMPEDHIAFEFQYLALLAERAYRHAEAGDDEAAQRERDKMDAFFNEHIAPWVPRFCDEALALAKTPFYQGLLQVTKAWVALERQACATGEE